ncbi:MAG: DUF5908 family protein [Opitutales bacterium]
MPVEIRKLVIRAVVEEDKEAGSPSMASPTAPTGGRPPGAASSERARLIAECVDQVMDVLREQKER